MRVIRVVKRNFVAYYRVSTARQGRARSNGADAVGVGMTDEHEIGFFVKRSSVAQASFGNILLPRSLRPAHVVLGAH
jgi:hypothetical protein